MGALNVRQRNFARLAAQGKKLVEAHELAYGNGKGKRKTKAEDASKLAARPEVKAAIAEYEAQFAEALAPIEDWRALRLEMLQNIRQLAHFAKDERVRYTASTHLQGYADEREKAEEQRRNRSPITIDGLIHEIRQLDAPEPTVELEPAASAQDEQNGELEAAEAAVENRPKPSQKSDSD